MLARVRRTLSPGKVVAGLAIGLFVTSAAQAQTAAPLWPSNTFRVIAGALPGSAYDAHSRLVARHIGRHLPGSPNVIVSNLAGAGSLTLATHLAANGPHDGSTIGGIISGLPSTLVLKPEISPLRPEGLVWVGSISSETSVFTLWHTAPAKSLADLFTTPVILGGTTQGTANTDFPPALNEVFGFKTKVVAGYKSASVVALAMERGEVDGNGGTNLSSVYSQSKAFVDDGRLKIIGQYGLKPHPSIPDVPLILDLAKSPDDRALLELFTSREDFGRPFITSPQVSKERLALLRASFNKLAEDAEFLADAKRMQTEISLTTGDELTEMANKLSATKPEILQRARRILDSTGK